MCPLLFIYKPNNSLKKHVLLFAILCQSKNNKSIFVTFDMFTKILRKCDQWVNADERESLIVRKHASFSQVDWIYMSENNKLYQYLVF